MVAVAQLVELLIVVQEVAGSSPVSHPTWFSLETEADWTAPCIVARGFFGFGQAMMGFEMVAFGVKDGVSPCGGFWL